MRGGVESQSPTLARRLADQEAITEEVTRVNSRLTQEIAGLQRDVEDARQLTQEIAGLQREVEENARLTQENARLTQQLLQQERQLIAPANGDRGQWWNLSHRTVVSTVLVIVLQGLGSYCTVGTRMGTSLVPRLLPQHLAWH